MLDSVLKFAWLIWALPMLASCLIAFGHLSGFNRGESGERHTAAIAVLSMLGSIAIIVALDISCIFNGVPGHIIFTGWLQSGETQIDIGMQIDWLSLAMMNAIALINLLATLFSINYLHREQGFQRFFMVLCLFSGAMLLLVSAGNLVLMFAGWELAGVSSYLLIAYAFDRDTATRNATHALISNRIGDAAFLLGIFLCLFWLQSSSWDVISNQAIDLSPFAASAISAALLIAALAKSGQLPFSGWIARALEGPTPSSAIFYGSVMVHAGIYLLIRLEPILTQSPLLMNLLVIIGLLNALYGYLVGLVQTDIKSRLIFSTISQIGLMLVGIGMGWFEATSWYLVAHMTWRAYQYLHAPSAMHLISQKPKPVPKWLAKQRWLYNAALERFWLDHISESLLIKPTQSFARDLSNFDEHIITRIVGLPNQVDAIAAAGNKPAQYQIKGVLGKFMDWLASRLHWFEEHLILKGGSTGLQSFISNLGRYLTQIERLLSQPRYLILMIVITFVVIL